MLGNISGHDGNISLSDISGHRNGADARAQWHHMNTNKFRELCEQVLVPLFISAIEPHLVDIHDVIDISSNELMRIGDRLDDIDAHLCRDMGEE